MSTYRTGNHWGVTIVREDEPHPAQLVAVVTTGDVKLAERICALLNGEAEYRHRCPGCGKHYRTPEAAGGCDADHRARAERVRPGSTR